MYGVEEMCRVLSVSRSGFYRWCKNGPSRRQKDNEQLLAQIRQIHRESNRNYGSPRITDALRQRGVKCNHKRIERLMRKNGIRSKRKRKFKVTTQSKHQRAVAADLIQQDFSAKQPNRLWTSDITYVRTQEGWLYLAVFLDVYSRRIVGWSMNHRLGDELIINAFKQAWHHRQPAAGLIVHSDRGSQYCSRSFKELLDIHRYRQSMSSTGNCYDNAITESFFATLKTELIYDERYRTRNEARRSIFKYIEIFYNRSRIHTSIGGLSPDQFEQMDHLA
jgi:transposase InsO family protein